MCSPVVLWTHPGEHPDPDIESRREQEAVHEQSDIFLSPLSVFYLALCLRGQRSPREAGRRSGERPRGKGNIDV